MKKISIITAVYNGELTIKNCIDSVLCQKYKNIEHIIIDGASSDKTAKIVYTYGSHINTFVSEKDKGPYFAFNKGIELATGDIIGILNADDFYVDPDVLGEIVAKFEDPEIEAVYGDLEYVDPVNTNKVVRYWKSGSFRLKKFLYGWMPPHPTFFVSREVYKQYGLFNTLLKGASDYEFMLRVMFKHRIKVNYLPKVIVRMRNGGVSNSSLAHRLSGNDEDWMAWKLNGLRPYFFTTILKPLRKIHQYYARQKKLPSQAYSEFELPIGFANADRTT